MRFKDELTIYALEFLFKCKNLHSFFITALPGHFFHKVKAVKKEKERIHVNQCIRGIPSLECMSDLQLGV